MLELLIGILVRRLVVCGVFSGPQSRRGRALSDPSVYYHSVLFSRRGHHDRSPHAGRDVHPSSRSKNANTRTTDPKPARKHRGKFRGLRGSFFHKVRETACSLRPLLPLGRMVPRFALIGRKGPAHKGWSDLGHGSESSSSSVWAPAMSPSELSVPCRPPRRKARMKDKKSEEENEEVSAKGGHSE